MTYILRIFFYALGLCLLICAYALNPATAAFRDLLVILHAGDFWQAVGLAFLTLIGADLVLSGKWAAFAHATHGLSRRKNLLQEK